MPTTKEDIIRFIQKIPDDCTLPDIMAELEFKQKVEQGLKDIEEGNTISHEEVKQRMAQWAKSTGQ